MRYLITTVHNQPSSCCIAKSGSRDEMPFPHPAEPHAAQLQPWNVYLFTDRIRTT